MNIEWMRGCATALVTPFTSDGAVDVERMHALVERQIKGGIHLLVPCGTTGESVTMTIAEREAVIGATIEAAKGRAYVIAGTGGNNTAAVVEQSQRARGLGVDAVLVVAPYYNKPTQEGLYQHFRAVAASVTDTPIMLYNVPGRTSSNLSAETTLRLVRDVENVVALKEASGNLTQIMEILRDRPRDFLVFSGDDAMAFALIALGAEGLVSVASNEAPRFMSQMVDAALSGRFREAREAHFRLLPLMDVNFIESSPGPVKAALALMGLLEEHLRLPLVPVTEKTRTRIGEVLNELGLRNRNDSK
ncbi:MAG: 4-hydroxy-tetrahydrodipicolinate synthase [Ktedonobacteraceae bacterium]|nr:4-hydroxy-tetrahydrodipicolinate synthase [Ktedonobacteraceae bacterium]